MAQPVWVLSVDLQTKTATFQSGMGDAAKSARGAFNDIQQGASGMSSHVGSSMTEARHGVMLLGEEFGIHLPRALTSFIASIGPVGAAMEAAFPFLAIIVGATLLIEHLVKMKEEADKLTLNQEKFLTATNNAFNALDQKLLEAGIRADELNKNHLGALKKQLELIDRQSMSELVHAFDEVSKAADVVFAELKSSWYAFGIGSAGAQHALAEFKSKYDSLLAQGKDKDAANLLSGTLGSAEKILAFQKQYIANQMSSDTGKGPHGEDADYNKFEEAALELKKAGVGVTDKEVQSQQQLVDALQAQLGVESRVADLKKLQQGNAKTSTGKEENNEAFKRLKAQVDAERILEDQENKDRDEARARAIGILQEGEKEKIEATQKGSAVRLAAIDAAIKEENNKGLQETSFYRSLLVSRVDLVRQMAEDEARIREEAGKESALHKSNMDALEIAAEKEHAQLINSGRRTTAAQLAAQETQRENEDFKRKQTKFAEELAALDKNGKDYENKVKAIHNREEELTRAHENTLTGIKEKAEEERNRRILSAEERFDQAIAQGLTNTIMRHESFAAMVSSISQQVLAGMLQNAIMSALLMDFGKEKDAAHAARKAFNWGWDHGGPAAPILAPAMGAMAFAATMAFNEGGMVPGIGNTDSVRAMLTPGEHVADQKLTEGLRGMVRDGGAQSKSPITLHYRPTYHVQTIDGDGIKRTLTKHADEFHRHFERSIRKLNR
jgi:hypothetical protein